MSPNLCISLELQTAPLSHHVHHVRVCSNAFRMRNIRSLSIGRLSSKHLAAEDFVEFGLELEDLKLAHSSIDTIKSHAFKNVRGLRRLDLSENRISQIENDAFIEIGHSLAALKISHGFASSMTAFPSVPMRTLTSLEQLDFSNNHFQTVADTSFHLLHDLRTIELHDNAIGQIVKGTFQVRWIGLAGMLRPKAPFSIDFCFGFFLTWCAIHISG